MTDRERAIRKELQRQAQATGMNRAEARRWLYGVSWKFSWPTRRTVLAQQVKENAARARAAG